MCTSSKPPVDNSAAIARQAEAERQARVEQGISSVDSAFTGFNPDFYNKYQSDYTGYYYPQLDDQYSDARKRLTLQLAKTGNLTSSSGINQMGDLQKYYDTQRTGVTNQAIDATNRLRSEVDSRKSQLYADARSSADPGSAASAAASAAQALQPGLPVNPLANTFADFFNNLGSTAAVYAGSNTGQQGGTQIFNNSGKSYKNYQ